MALYCPKCRTPVDESYTKAGRISTASVRDFSIFPTDPKAIPYKTRETAELRYVCKNCRGEFSESEVLKEENGTFNIQ